jgi:hypothetical protein
VFQTEGEPPSRGRTIFANIGSTRKRSAELTNSETANRMSMDGDPV